MPSGQYYQRMPQRQVNGMAVAALIMALLAVLTIITGLGPVFFGSMAILFAVLSKGGNRRMKGTALSGVLLSVVSIVAGILLMIKVTDLIQHDPMVRQQVDQSFEMMYGVDYDGFMDGMKNYYETGEMPEFMENIQKGEYPYYSYPGGGQL